MAGLIDLPTAKMHLLITDDLHDADVTLKTRQAEAVILNYLGDWLPTPAWDTTTLPPEVQAAMLEFLAHLYDPQRGDDTTDRAGKLWDDIARLLARYRGPTIV